MLTPDQLADLRAASAVTGWPNDTYRQQWDDGEPVPGVYEIGCTNEDDELYEVMIIDTANYGVDDAAEKLARFYTAFNPESARRLLAHIDAQAARIAELERDAARLDYVLANSAFLCEGTNGTGEKDYQLWTENEEEHYIVLSGLGKCFASTRAAIDAAMESKS